MPIQIRCVHIPKTAKNGNWLDRHLIFDCAMLNKCRTKSNIDVCRQCWQQCLVRVLKPFDQCSRSGRTKIRRFTKISYEIGGTLLSASYLNHLRSIGMQDEAKIVEKLRSASPNRKVMMLKFARIVLTKQEALVLLIDTDL